MDMFCDQFVSNDAVHGTGFEPTLYVHQSGSLLTGHLPDDVIENRRCPEPQHVIIPGQAEVVSGLYIISIKVVFPAQAVMIVSIARINRKNPGWRTLAQEGVKILQIADQCADEYRYAVLPVCTRQLAYIHPELVDPPSIEI